MKKLNKKQKKYLLVTGIIIGAIIISIIGFSSFSIFYGVSKLNCIDSGSSDVMTCRAEGLSGSGESVLNGKTVYQFAVNKPSRQDERVALMCNKLYLSDTNCGEIAASMQYGENSNSYRPTVYATFDEKFGNQLIISEGSFTSISGEQVTFKTYGLCKTAGLNGCWVSVPEEALNSSLARSDTQIYPGAVSILFKLGGYTETDITTLEMQKIISVYRFHYNTCEQISIMKNQKTENDYLILSECESHIESVTNYFRFQDNSCSDVSILPSQKTELDYATLEECQEKIIVEETPESPKTNIFLLAASIIGIIIFIVGLIFLFKWLKKK